MLQTTTGLYAYAGNYDSPIAKPAAGIPSITSARFDGASTDLSILSNGLAEIVQTGINAGAFDLDDGFDIGGAGASLSWEALIGAVIIYPFKLTDPQHESVKSELSAWYGITAI